MIPKFTNVRGMSELLGVSEKKAWKMVYAREVDVCRIGRSVKIPLSSIQALVEQSLVPAKCA